MKYFFWIVRGAHEHLLECCAGVSSAYTPPDPGGHLSRDLLNSVVFVIVRGVEADVFLKKIFVRRVAELIDEKSGKPTGLLEIEVDLTKSIGLSESFRAGRVDFSVDVSRSYNEGIYEISRKVALKLWAKTGKKFVHKFLSFSPRLFVEPTRKGNTPSADARNLIQEIVHRVPLNRIWGDGRGRKNPLLNFAEANAEHLGLSEETKRLLPLLCESSLDVEFSRTSDVPEVDTELEFVDVKKIIARRFVCTGAAESNFLEALEKTEAAEERHQCMLRDLCEFFRGKGMEPAQSRSVDLAIRGKGVLHIFEIKTANSENVFSQTAKGVFQLATYSREFLREGETSVRKILVVEENFGVEMRDFISDVVRDLGTEVIFYDERGVWLERLSPPFSASNF